MEFIENLDVILSVICAVGSIIMFFKAKQEKNECVKIHTQITNTWEMISSSKEIRSQDEFNINQVETFDNRKSIK